MKGTDTLHPPSRHCAIMSHHHKVVSGKPSKLYVMSFSKTRSFWQLFGENSGVFVESEYFINSEREGVARTGHGDVGSRGRVDGVSKV